MDRNYAEFARGRTPETAWAECPRGDWLIEIAAEAGAFKSLLVLSAAACARLALAYVPAGEGRPLAAIEAAEAWARGEAALTAVEPRVHAAFGAGHEAARALGEGPASPTVSAAPAACYAAAHAAQAAHHAGQPSHRWTGRDRYQDAAHHAVQAARCVAESAQFADRDEMHRRCADAVRAVIPFPLEAQAAA